MSHLGGPSRELLVQLDRHRVLTSGQLARLTGAPARTVTYRLDKLHTARLVTFARPGREAGSSPQYWWRKNSGAGVQKCRRIRPVIGRQPSHLGTAAIPGTAEVLHDGSHDCDAGRRSRAGRAATHSSHAGMGAAPRPRPAGACYCPAARGLLRTGPRHRWTLVGPAPPGEHTVTAPEVSERVYAKGDRCSACQDPLVTDFEAWYRARRQRLFHYVLSRGCQRADAEDVVQDTFSALRVRKVRWLLTPGGWLTHVATRKAASVRRDLLLGNEETKLIDYSRRVTWTSLAPQHDPESAERLRIALRAMAQLPDRRRVVTVLAAAGWTHREIADGLGITVGTVSAHVKQGRNSMSILMRGGRFRIGSLHGTNVVIGKGRAGDVIGDGLACEASTLAATVWVWCPSCGPGKDPQRWISSSRLQRQQPDPDPHERMSELLHKDRAAAVRDEIDRLLKEMRAKNDFDDLE
ncbi:sigma factor-like helix-turn-helix DNA-binding protein [Actinoplanes sp. NPDC020271]|uniref:sigma factor-like helix-turn-helix DNA-binding protein n=1 Tax=Actinoplanes sp. NPDC020271 TaxID=3363896 RepID=UPI00378F8A34